MEHGITSVIQKFVTVIWRVYYKIYWLILSVVVDALNIIKDKDFYCKKVIFWFYPFVYKRYIFSLLVPI
jgi:hypothetical protein